jgi:chromosome segregation ATPase
MTTAQPDRLDRIEALLDRMASDSARSKEESDRRMGRLEESHAALSRDLAQLVSTQQAGEVQRQELREAMIRLADTQEGVVRLLSSLDEDRPTILRKLNTIEDKVDTLLQHQGGEA